MQQPVILLPSGDFGSNKYSPPCWVNRDLQKKLSASPIWTHAQFRQIGLELWEASGGQDIGLKEFIKFAKKPGSSVNLSNENLGNIWKSYFPPDTKCSSSLVLPVPAVNPPPGFGHLPFPETSPDGRGAKAPSVPKIEKHVSCGHCGNVFRDQTRRNYKICTGCVEAAKIVSKVIDFLV